MANWFVDTALGTGANDGTTTDNARRGTSGIKTAIEYASYANGDKIWIRRTSAYDEGVVNLNADISPVDDGTIKAPLYVIGAPRPAIPNTTITQGDWTNGSTIVDNVVGITPTRGAHIARWATAPDGKQYLITAILWEVTLDGVDDAYTVGVKLTNTTRTKYGKVYAYTDLGGGSATLQYVRDSSTAWVENDHLHGGTGTDGNGDIAAAGETPVGFIIDRPYIGSTVTGTNGLFQIDADEDYAEFHAIDDSAWTIKIATWEADAHNLPIIDFNDEAYCIEHSGDNFWSYRNIEFKDADDASILSFVAAIVGETIGCLFKQTTKNRACHSAGYGTMLLIDRCISEGSGGNNTSQNGFTLGAYGGRIINSVAYNCYSGIIVGSVGQSYFENINLGIEIANYYLDVATQVYSAFVGRDIKAALLDFNSYSPPGNYIPAIRIENYNKVLGAHYQLHANGNIQKLDVVEGSGTPYKRSGGADSVVKVAFSISSSDRPPIKAWENCPAMVHEFEADGTSKTYRYYIQADAALSADQIWLEAEYCDAYEDSDEYHMTKLVSTGSVAIKTGSDDWTEYLEVTVDPAVASKVRIKLFINYYHATNCIYIDPKVVIS